MSNPAATGAREAPPPDLVEFLVELSVTLHKHTIYPAGHPSLAPAAEALAGQAARLLESRPQLAFGIGRHQLIVDGLATDPKHPVLRRVAELLHKHHLGAVSIAPGVEARELGAALLALATEPDREGPIGLSPAHQLPECPHVHLYPLTFDRIGIVGEAGRTDDGSMQGGFNGADLWAGLAQAALLPGAADDGAERSADPAAIARAIDAGEGNETQDLAVTDYLRQIAGQLRTASGHEAHALRDRTARLIGSIRPETLRRLVAMGGDMGQRAAFALDATHGMAVDSVLQIVSAVGEAGGQTISHGLLRMLTKLSAHAEAGGSAGGRADTALRDQVERLLAEWNLADPNPDEYRGVLQYLATSPLGASGAQIAENEAVTLRLVQMSLEVGATGPLVERAVEACVRGGGVGDLIEALDHAPMAGAEVVQEVRSRLGQPATMASLLSREPFDDTSVDALMPFVGAEGYGVLLDALATSPSRATRRKLLDRLGKAPPEVVGLIGPRLNDSRWYVQRNMLLLLSKLGRLPPGFDFATWTAHKDARVRIEAIRLQMGLPGGRQQALQAALHDADARVLQVGLAAVQHDCPAALIRLVVGVVHAIRAPDNLRLLAVEALAHTRDPRALQALLPLVLGGYSLLGRPKLAPKSPLMLAALKALALRWRQDAHVAAVLAVAAASSDLDVRAAARARS